MTDEERCYASALRILNHRFNSREELRRKLMAKRHAADVIEATLARLEDERWLDDERFASAYVRARLQKRIGRLRIRRELIAAGVSDAVADDALRQSDGSREGENLAALCQKKIAIIARRQGDDYARSDAGRKKLTTWLLRQGYGIGDVIEAVDRVVGGKLKIEN